jgi:HEAT repeat protein
MQTFIDHSKVEEEYLQRVEDAFDKGNEAEARRLIEAQIFNDNPVASFETSPRAKVLMAKMEQERNERYRKEQQQALERHLRDIKHDDRTIRNHAIFSLRFHQDDVERVVPALIELRCTQADATVGQQALDSLRYLGRPYSGQKTIGCLEKIAAQQTNIQHRQEALLALGLIGPKASAATELIVASLDDEKIHGTIPIWVSAAIALEKIAPDHEKVVPALRRALSYNSETCLMAIVSLENLGSHASPALPDLLKIKKGDWQFKQILGQDGPERMTELRRSATKAIICIE